MSRIVHSRGYVFLESDRLTALAEAQKLPEPKQDGHFHVTLLTKDELRALNSDQHTRLKQWMTSCEPCDSEVIDLGIGCNGKRTIFFRVVVFPAGAEIRRLLNLPWKQFHVTLSAKDDHTGGLCRGAESIIPDDFNSQLSEKDFDKAFLLYVHGGQTQDAHALSIRFRDVNRASPVAHIRFADSALSLSGQHKLGLLAYMFASTLPGISEKMTEYCLRQINRCAGFVEFPVAYAESELTQAETAVTDGFPEYLLPPPESLKQLIQRYTGQFYDMQHDPSSYPASLMSRERMYVWRTQEEPYKLPRFFRWLVPYRLAIMATPRNQDDIEVLHNQLGITLVVTLTEETPLPASWFAKGQVRNVLLPVENYKAPSIAQVDHFLGIIEALPEGQAALVHCGAGKGRAGTFAACYLAKNGFFSESSRAEPGNAADVIKILRHMRPGSIETEEQERFVSKYVSHLWKTLGDPTGTSSAMPEAEDSLLQLDGALPSKTKTIILCGLPGSGKSTFSASITAATGDSFTVVSQDELGSRSAFLNALSTAFKSRKRVIVDKCNPTPSVRREVLAIAFNPADAICVHFSYSADLCISRANQRTSHPTVRQGLADKIVKRFEKEFLPPSRAEGFACVATVTSFAAATDLIRRLTGSSKLSPSTKSEQLLAGNASQPEAGMKIVKFPRTRHLLNLGAATRDDLVMNAAELAAFFASTQGSAITLEEKVDGANMGISIDENTLAFRVQNRSHYVNSKSQEQFRKLDAWLERHAGSLRTIIKPGRTIVFGEWLFARHSIPYTRLSDTFLIFDMYDIPTKTFLSRAAISEQLCGTDLHQVPEIELPTNGTMTVDALRTIAMGTPSSFYDGTVEGIYVRKERDGVVVDRAKVVRTDFIAGNDHWGKGRLILNGVAR